MDALTEYLLWIRGAFNGILWVWTDDKFFVLCGVPTGSMTELTSEL